MRQTTSTITPALTEHPEQPVVLSEFQVDGHQFYIICLDSNSGVKLSLDDPTQQSSTYTEIKRFQVRGQTCAVVRAEEFSTSGIDLITLLTQRELQIATLVASGQVNKQIAHQLCISEWTVSTHLRRIFIKLGVDSRAAMVYQCAPIIQKLFGQETVSQVFPQCNRLK